MSVRLSEFTAGVPLSVPTIGFPLLESTLGELVLGTRSAYYDRGSIRPFKCILNDGVFRPKIVGMPITFGKKDVFVYSGHGIIHRDEN